ncbi:hypothetical protein [Agrobacterium sp.]|uniref:hypothetical protein n=1 Tax=Agrobacterium sp. TaxID=361 RepID=UPI0028AEEC56|nr:hypothetical protein [Agrobacterium sp.]
MTETDDEEKPRMRRLTTLLAIPGLTCALAACNTSDALTPQVGIGEGLQPASSPLTQNDLDRASAAADTQTAYQPQHVQTYRPQNTLDAQAHALATGAGQYQQPMVQSQPIAEAPPMQQAQPAPQMQAPQESASLAPASSTGSIRFLPIIGAPVQAVTPLSRQLGAEARAQGLTIRSSTDTSSDHILKGYFSAFPDSGKVTIVFVWDVLDNSGARLHRLQGQESMPGKGSDPWAAVTPAAMEKIANRTLNEYMAWRNANAG